MAASAAPRDRNSLDEQQIFVDARPRRDLALVRGGAASGSRSALFRRCLFTMCDRHRPEEADQEERQVPSTYVPAACVFQS